MYEILRSRLEQGGYTFADAEGRINYLVAVGQITPEMAEELHAIAMARADVPSETDERVSALAGQAEAVRQAVAEVGAMLTAMRPAVQSVALETYSDGQLVASAALFDEWAAGTAYMGGTAIRHGGVLYRVQQDVTAQTHQQPGGAGMLAVYAPVQVQSPEDEAAGKALPWVSGETGLAAGDRREYNGVVYEAIQAPGANVWTPDAVPAIWRAV